MIQLPVPTDATPDQILDLTVETRGKEGAIMLPFLVSPHPGKYYEVDSFLIYLFSKPNYSSERPGLLSIADCHYLHEVQMPWDVVESHKVSRARMDAARGNKN